MGEIGELIRYSEVVFRVGKALFKEEFIPGLLWRDRWLLETTGLADADDNPYDGIIGYYSPDPLGPFADLPELLGVRAKRAFMTWQRQQISSWIDQHKLQVIEGKVHDQVDRAAFEAAFSRAFPSLTGTSSTPAVTDVADQDLRRGGRPQKWDWKGAAAAYAAHLGRHADGLPAKQADAEQWVAKWFCERHPQGESPPITEIRTRVVAPIYQADREVGNRQR
jgi:hypothetical protein